MDAPQLNRRTFLGSTTAAAAAAAAGAPAHSAPLKPVSGRRSKVVLIRDPSLLTEVRRGEVSRLGKRLDEALCALLAQPTAAAAWGACFAAQEVVGLKTNTMMLKTPKALIRVLTERLCSLGVAPERIRDADREAREALRDCTALINTCALKTHWLSGISGAVKNYLPLAAPDADGTWSRYHADNCAAAGSVWKLPICRGKTRLIVVDALCPLFHGGPQVDPRYRWNYGGLLVGTDPVALDTVGLEILLRKREAYLGEPWPLSSAPDHVHVAAHQYGLGQSDWERLELIRLGWREGDLV